MTNFVIGIICVAFYFWMILGLSAHSMETQKNFRTHLANFYPNLHSENEIYLPGWKYDEGDNEEFSIKGAILGVQSAICWPVIFPKKKTSVSKIEYKRLATDRYFRWLRIRAFVVFTLWPSTILIWIKLAFSWLF